MNPVVKLMRPLNCSISSMSILIVTVTLFGLDITSQETLLLTGIGMIVVFFFTAGGNILNDYMDRETDEINHPERPIPSGKISPQTALLLSGVMFASGLGFSFLLPFYWPQLIVILALILLTTYEVGFKKKGLVGNLTISALTGMLFVFGGAIYGRLFLPLILGYLAFLASVGREITKDIQDIQGDLDRKTYPMKVGPKAAKRTAAGFILLAVILSPSPYLLELLPSSYLLTVLVSDIIFIYSLSLLNSAERAQKFIKIAMIVALVAFLIGGII